jgi:hypothetical protein
MVWTLFKDRREYKHESNKWNQSFLSNRFDMKDLGEADVILNIKLIKNESGITLMQYW